jgi:hypothetical protein
MRRVGLLLKGRSKKSKEDKFEYVMGEFKAGKLRSGSGEIVTDRKQALAIAASEAGVGYNKALSPSDLVFLKSHMGVDELVELTKADATPGSAMGGGLGKPIFYSSAASDALRMIQQSSYILTDEELVSKVELLKTHLSGVLPEGDIRALVFSAIDKFKNVRGLDDNTIWNLIDIVRSVLRAAVDPVNKAMSEGKFLEPLVKAGLFKAKYIKREGGPGHYVYTYAGGKQQQGSSHSKIDKMRGGDKDGLYGGLHPDVRDFMKKFDGKPYKEVKAFFQEHFDKVPGGYAIPGVHGGIKISMFVYNPNDPRSKQTVLLEYKGKIGAKNKHGGGLRGTTGRMIQ